MPAAIASDAEFDQLYPPYVQSVSKLFWTPVAVARRAAKLLVTSTSTCVLDIGSGSGKFCIVGAATTGATFIGVERRKHLVTVAKDAAARAGVERAHFIHGTFDMMDPLQFDALYFFNPFEENMWTENFLDRTVDLSYERFIADVRRAEQFLGRASVGTRVVTYHGFRGEMPSTYRLIERERCHTSHLELWIKTEPLDACSGQR